jgi:hypothetical protein
MAVRSSPQMSPELRDLLDEEGFVEITKAWYRPPAGAAKDGKAGPSSAAQRQREQVKRDAAIGKARCTVKTADDEASRELLAEVGQAMFEGRAAKNDMHHRALRAALRNPSAVLIGERVLALRGIRRRVVLSLAGAVDPEEKRR